MAPQEPEYIWVRKDQYTPGLFDTLTDKMGSGTNKQQNQELEQRMAKLEENLKNKNAQAPQTQAPQVVYAVPGSLPGAPLTPVSPPTFTYPSPRMKRRVLVLGLSDQTNYKEEHLAISLPTGSYPGWRRAAPLSAWIRIPRTSRAICRAPKP